MSVAQIWLTHAQLVEIGKLTAHQTNNAPIAISRATHAKDEGYWVPAIRAECADEEWVLASDGEVLETNTDQRAYRILLADEEGINVRYTYEQARRAGIEV